MAWTEQCRIDACAQINKRKPKLGGAKPAIRELSKESGIPIRTLESWYWPDRSAETCAPCEKVNQTFETCAISDLESLIGKQFGTIYADPPWPYQNQATRSATNNVYKTMRLQDIADLPINQLTKDKAHLHLWTTNAFLFDAKAIIEAWGFEYKSCFIWVKPQMGIGNYWRLSHEFLLLGVKGKQTFLARNEKSWIHESRGEHSVKPEKIREIIERVSPGPYLELFARRPVDNWTVWGNEISRSLFHQTI